jgi:hypothetical protein
VKLLSVDTDDPAVLDAFLKEVALCACLRGCDRVVRLLGACLGGCTPAADAGTAAASPAVGAPRPAPGSDAAAMAAAAAAAAAAPSADTPTPFASALPPDLYGNDSTAAPDASDSNTGGGGGGAGRAGSGQQQQQQLALIMELVEGGNLAHRIYSPSKRALSYLEVGDVHGLHERPWCACARGVVQASALAL